MMHNLDFVVHLAIKEKLLRHAENWHQITQKIVLFSFIAIEEIVH